MGQSDETEVNRLLTTALTRSSALRLCLSLRHDCCAGCAAVPGRAGRITVFRSVVPILGINVVVSFLAAPVNMLLAGHTRFDVATRLQFVMLPVPTALIVRSFSCAN